MYYRYFEVDGTCSGHGNSVVIRELSLYPQSLLAKLTVVLAEQEEHTFYEGMTLVKSV